VGIARVFGGSLRLARALGVRHACPNSYNLLLLIVT